MNMPLPHHVLPEVAAATRPMDVITPQPKTAFRVGLLLIALLLALVAFALQSIRVPDQPISGQGTTAFSAARAMTQLKQIAQRPHPTGSAENAAVRSYLLAQLTALGLKPEVQSGIGFSPSNERARAGMVHNVVARLPAQGQHLPTHKAIVLAAHYDSVATSVGAADDGASVAAILETLRALQAGPPLAVDVIVVLTDGEEAGLLGSELFMRAHPWAAQAGLVLNFEFRGNEGPMLMFETSIGNGALIDGFAASVPHPVSNSLLYEMYRLLPNDTDLTNFKRGGAPSMNFAAIGHPAAYHTRSDVPEALDQRTLQHEGDTMLALVRHFGARPLGDLKAGDSIYFQFPGLGLVQYPASMAWPLALLVVALFGVTVALAVKRGMARGGRVIGATIVFILSAVGMAIGSQLLWLLMSFIHDEYRWFSDPHNSVWYLLATAALLLAGFAALTEGFTRWFKPLEMSFAGLAVGLLLLIHACVRAPGFSFVLTWAMLPVLCVIAFTCLAPGRTLPPMRTLCLLFAGVAPAVLLFSPLIGMLHVGVGVQFIGASALAILILFGLMHPLLSRLTRPWLLPALPVLAGLALLVTGSLTRSFDEQNPRQTNLFYAFDAVSEQAFWLSRDSRLDSWNRQFFGNARKQVPVPEIFGAKSSPFWAASAPRLEALQAPSIELLQDAVEGAQRTVRVRLKSLRQAPSMMMVLEGAPLIRAMVGPMEVSGPQKETWRFTAHGMGAAGVELELTLAPGKPFELRVFDETAGLPETGFPPRPADFMATPNGSNGDTTRAVRSLAFP